jgi:phage terminase large subunit
VLVSRPELKYDNIINFPVQTRFLKLPIENFLKIEGIDPLDPQIAMINAINDPVYRQIVACLSRRTGKTYISNTIAFLKAMEPKSNILIVSPNYSLTNISWNLQVQQLERHGIEIKSKNKTDREIHLENGSMIKFGSVSQADSLVGRSYDLIIYDEAAIDGNGGDAYNVQLRPTLDKNNSKIIFISTPRGSNFFEGFYQRGFSAEFPSWVSIHSTWRDNPRMGEADVAEARKGMSRAEFEQEYEAKFTTFEGQVYEDFDAETMSRDLSDMVFDEYDYDTIMGIDPGYRDETAALILKYHHDSDVFYLVWEYLKAGANTGVHAQEFLEADRMYCVDQVFCDQAAAQFREDLISMFDFPSNPANKSILDGISYVQRIIQQGKLIVDSKCVHALEMLTNYRWDMNPALTKPKTVHDKYSHMADALRYALYSFVK